MAMTQTQAIQALQQIAESHKGDFEKIHGEADALLLTFLRERGFARLADAYAQLAKA